MFGPGMIGTEWDSKPEFPADLGRAQARVGGKVPTPWIGRRVERRPGRASTQERTRHRSRTGPAGARSRTAERPPGHGAKAVIGV
jgi:hypothetical protein